eukprot:246939_1
MMTSFTRCRFQLDSLCQYTRTASFTCILRQPFSSSIQSNRACDVAIIGSGIMGLNTAFQIARRCPSTKIKVFEKAPGPEYGSSGASSGICRHLYTLENQIRFTVDGVNLYKNWQDYLQYKEASAVFTETGLLLMSPMTKQQASQEKSKYDTLDLGIRTTIVDQHMMKTRFPQINSDISSFDNSGEQSWEPKSMDTNTFFLYEENSGYFEPVQALTDLRNVLREQYHSTVSLHYNTDVKQVLHSGGAVKGLQIATPDGDEEIYCGTVVNSCGPWYNKVIKDLDLCVKLKLSPVRIQVIYKDCPDLYEKSFLEKYGKENGVPIPIIIDALSGAYMRPQKQSKQILCSTISEKEERDVIDPDQPLPAGADPEYRNKYLNSLYHRLEPILKPTSSKVQSINGIYTVCENDVHYLIGPTKLNGFIVCNGFSGHGFKCAPAVGSMIAQHLTNIKIEGDTDVPITFYSPYRQPYVIKEKNVLA